MYMILFLKDKLKDNPYFPFKLIIIVFIVIIKPCLSAYLHVIENIENCCLLGKGDRTKGNPPNSTFKEVAIKTSMDEKTT